MEKIGGDYEKSESYNERHLGKRKRKCTEKASAEIYHKGLYKRNRCHYDEKHFVFTYMRAEIYALCSRGKAVEYTEKNKEPEKCAEVLYRIFRCAVKGSYFITAKEIKTNSNRKHSRKDYMPYHISAEQSFATFFRLFLHYFLNRRFSRERKTAESVHYYIYPKHLHDGNGGINSDKWSYKADKHRAEIHRKLKCYKFSYTCKYRAPIEDCFDDRAEIIIEDNYIARLFGNVGTATHCKAYIRFF